MDHNRFMPYQIAAWMLLLLAACQPGPVKLSPTPPLPAAATNAPAAAIQETVLPLQPEYTRTPESATAVPPTFTTVPPTPTEAPAPRQLTTGGCCTLPSWSPDSTQVIFIDKPSEAAQAGIWGVPVGGGEAHLVTTRLGVYSDDYQYLAYLDAGKTVVEHLANGKHWVIPSGGRAVTFSPDDAWVAWTAGPSGPPFDTPQREVWVSRSDGSQPNRVQVVYGGGFSGWLAGGRLLFSGRLSLQEKQQGIWAVSVSGGEPVQLTQAERFRSVVPSPGGSWLAYQVAFAEDPQTNGLWAVNTTTLQRVRMPVFGAFRWRSDDRLLVIPLDANQPVQTIWEVQLPNGEARPLTDPASVPVKIANGDWSVSPDGQYVVYLSADDMNLWLLTLPK